MPLMLNVLLNMRSASAIRCGSGNHPNPFYKNWRPSPGRRSDALRQRLLLVRQQLQQPITEQQGFIDSTLQKQLAKSCQASLKAINADLEAADKQIKIPVSLGSHVSHPYESGAARAASFKITTPAKLAKAKTKCWS